MRIGLSLMPGAPHMELGFSHDLISSCSCVILVQAHRQGGLGPRYAGWPGSMMLGKTSAFTIFRRRAPRPGSTAPGTDGPAARRRHAPVQDP